MSQGKLALAIAVRLMEIHGIKAAKGKRIEVEADVCDVAEKLEVFEARYDRDKPSAQWPKRRAIKNLVLQRRSRRSKRR